MEIAYLILAHKYPKQLIRIISRLKTDKTSIFVHIDQKTHKKIFQELVSNLNAIPNVYFLKRQKVYWGDFSQVSATLEGIQTIISEYVTFDYVKLLSGQDYPIKSRMQIEKTLQGGKGKSFIEYFSLPCEKWEDGGEKNGGMDRINYFHFHIRNRRFTLPFKRNFPEGFKPFAGSSYWFLSREHAEYIIDFVKQNPEFVDFFKNVNLPDEIFFQTVILNSPLRENIINNDLTYTEWLGDSSHPEVFNKNHFEKLFKSPCLFARKFDITKDSEVLDLIDKNILHDDK